MSAFPEDELEYVTIVTVPTSPTKFDSIADLWEFIYRYDAPEDLQLFERSWLAQGATIDEIARSVLIAATHTKVAYQDKLAYMTGILRNKLRDRGVKVD